MLKHKTFYLSTLVTIVLGVVARGEVWIWLM